MTTASSSPKSEKPKAGQVLRAVVFWVFVLGLLAVSIAMTSGLSDPNNHYSVFTWVVVYVFLVETIALSLWSSLRLAKGSEYSARLYSVTFWVVLSVFSVVTHFGK